MRRRVGAIHEKDALYDRLQQQRSAARVLLCHLLVELEVAQQTRCTTANIIEVTIHVTDDTFYCTPTSSIGCDRRWIT